MSFESLLNRQGIQERYTETQNSFGETEKVWSVIEADFKCRVQFNNPNITKKNIDLIKGGLGDFIPSDYTIYSLVSYNVIDNDRITIDGIKYKVLKAQKDSSLHHWELKCEIIK